MQVNLQTAELLLIGDELLSGETNDTNSHWLDAQLERAGWMVSRHVTVPDDRAAIAQAYREAASRSALVISSGGLGPTQDDVTMAALADALGVPLRKDEATLESIRARFARFKREMTPNNEQQAMVPSSGEVLPNEVGTAPGFAAQLGAARIFLTPGVPREMKWFFANVILPRIDRGAAALLRRTIKVVGLGESRVEHLISAVVVSEPTVRFGYRTLGMENHVKLATSDAAALSRAELAVRAALGDHVYGADDDQLEVMLGRLLSSRGETVALAESCTGGWAAKRLTDVAGSSKYVAGGVVAYSNQVKISLLGVDRALLETHGAVSAEVASAMAAGVRDRLQTTWGLSATGIAGPSGGTPSKPVGTVFIGLAGPSGASARGLHLPGDREQIRGLTVTLLLDLLRQAMTTSG